MDCRIDEDKNSILKTHSTLINTYEEKNLADVDLFIFNKSNEFNWTLYLPLTLKTFHENQFLISQLPSECMLIVKHLFPFEEDDSRFHQWFFPQLESILKTNAHPTSSSLILRSIEQERYDCTKYLLVHQLFNIEYRDCLLLLTYQNSSIEFIEYFLTHYSSLIDLNKIDFNHFTCFHYSCRHFNLSLSKLLFSYINKQILHSQTSEFHTPLDYWIECLCTLKKCQSINNDYHSNKIQFDFLLNNHHDYKNHVVFFQKLINYNGQLTNIPSRYIRLILSQLTFEQKFLYMNHHLQFYSMIYKNRLSTLMKDYDQLKITIQAGDILKEFLYALGQIQLEIQNHLITSNVMFQAHMRILYFKFFRLFQCMYFNPDVNMRHFHFEYIFRRVWIYWKEPVKVFLRQSQEKMLTLKSICRTIVYRQLRNYPADIQNLSIHLQLKQFLAFDNPFFVIKR